VIVEAARLLSEEERAWVELRLVFGRIPKARMEEPGVTGDGWSPKDVMFHLGAWLALAVDDVTTDDRNRAWFELSRTLDVPTVRAELESSRLMAHDALASLAEITPEARGWFEESAQLHYAEHLPDLIRWLDG
jgi:hypothetical protein